MSNIEDKLEEGESITFKTDLHWAIFSAPLLVILIAGLSIPAKGMSAVILLAIGTAWSILSAISRQKNAYVITTRRVLVQRWFALKRFYDIPHSEILHLDINQPTLGKLLNFGRITLYLSRKRRVSFRLVNAPFDFLAKLKEQIPPMQPETEKIQEQPPQNQ